jgi:hypothetical protein
MPAVVVELKADMSDPAADWLPETPSHFAPDLAASTLTQALNRAFEAGLKTLLESKHLYQKVTVDADQFLAAVRKRVLPGFQHDFDGIALPLLASARFTPAQEPLFIEERAGTKKAVFTLLLSNVKVFCAECDAREVSNPIWYVDAANELWKLRMHERRVSPPPPGLQLFLLIYQCQRCIGAPKSFFVRRQGWQLSLEGRSPIEHIEVPGYIPKAEQSFFRDAIIAFNTGKTLGALFYLRTFIEQFARRQTGIADRRPGDEILEAYSKSLPEEHRDHMPSLRKWYEALSEALHAAKEDEKLFEEARAEIEKHFDIRRVFGIK